MKSLATCLNRMVSEGYTEDFKVTEQGLQSVQHNQGYAPEQIQVVNFYRFEGESSPADSAILYAIRTNDGSEGLLSDAYGAYADENITKFISEVEKIQKDTDVNPNPKTEEKMSVKEIFKTTFLW